MDPTADLLERALLPEADLMALFMARTSPDEIVVCSEFVSAAEPGVFYVLHLKGIGFEGIIDHVQDGQPTQTTDRNFLDRRFFACSFFSLSELGDPVLIFAGAEVEEEGVVGRTDHMAWQMVEVPTIP